MKRELKGRPAAPTALGERSMLPAIALMPGIAAIAGNIERSPKAVGAAGLPFSSRFMVE
jgi:hypothetical protein